MRIDVAVPSFAKLMRDVEGDVAKAATGAMRDTTPDATRELRDQVVSAGLGQRLANTWRGDVYPPSRQSLNPAGFIHSAAPDIIDAFVRGATIVPINGGRYLAIPTDNVPRQVGSRSSKKRMTPVEVEAAFDQEMFVKRGRDGHLLLFINAVAAKNGRGWRRGTKGRLAGGRKLKPILMFTLVPTTRMPRLLDLDGPAQHWAAAFEDAFTRRLAG